MVGPVVMVVVAFIVPMQHRVLQVHQRVNR